MDERQQLELLKSTRLSYFVLMICITFMIITEMFSTATAIQRPGALLISLLLSILAGESYSAWKDVTPDRQYKQAFFSALLSTGSITLLSINFKRLDDASAVIPLSQAALISTIMSLIIACLLLYKWKRFHPALIALVFTVLSALVISLYLFIN